MGWRKRTSDLLAEWLRFVARAGWLVIGVLVAIFCVWFAANFLRSLAQWLGRVFFQEPW